MSKPEDTNKEALIYAFEEFDLYYQSTEKVTDRRLALNTWNYGLCVAIMSAVGLLTTFSIAEPGFQLVSVVAICAFAVVGILLCSLWTGQIRDFKMLNNAKFEVLNAMAPWVTFPTNARSAQPFLKEWQILERSRATSELNSIKIVTLRSSNAEFLVPRAFMVIFFGTLISSAIFAAINWRAIISNVFLP
jgi:hypothetical protein